MNEVELIRSLRSLLRCQDRELLEHVRKLREKVCELEEEVKEFETLLRSLTTEVEAGKRFVE